MKKWSYRLMEGLAERVRLAEDIFRLIEPDLRFFVFNSLSHDAAKDVLQDILKAIAKRQVQRLRRTEGLRVPPTRCKIIRRGFSTELPTRATQRNDVWMWDAWNQANLNCPKRNAGRITLPAF
jgi:hypothetical protein